MSSPIAKPRSQKTGVLTLLAALALTACSEGGSTAPANEAPTANPEPTLEVTAGETAVLDARAVDPDGDQLVVTWSQISGPPVGNLNGPVATFTAPDEVSTLVYDVIVSDGETQTAPQRVVVWVVESRGRTFWVSPQGSDSNSGTRESPFASITVARNAAAQNGGDVYIAAGSYSESVALADGVSLYGGYDPSTWLRDVGNRATVIRGWEHGAHRERRADPHPGRSPGGGGGRLQKASPSHRPPAPVLLRDPDHPEATSWPGGAETGIPGVQEAPGLGASGGSGGDAKAFPPGRSGGAAEGRSGHNGGGTGGQGNVGPDPRECRRRKHQHPGSGGSGGPWGGNGGNGGDGRNGSNGQPGRAGNGAGSVSSSGWVADRGGAGSTGGAQKERAGGGGGGGGWRASGGGVRLRRERRRGVPEDWEAAQGPADSGGGASPGDPPGGQPGDAGDHRRADLRRRRWRGRRSRRTGGEPACGRSRWQPLRWPGGRRTGRTGGSAASAEPGGGGAVAPASGSWRPEAPRRTWAAG